MIKLYPLPTDKLLHKDCFKRFIRFCGRCNQPAPGLVSG